MPELRRLTLHPGPSSTGQRLALCLFRLWSSVAFTAQCSRLRYGPLVWRRPAAVDALDAQMVPVGIPSFVAEGAAAFARRFFFVELVRRRPSPDALQIPMYLVLC